MPIQGDKRAKKVHLFTDPGNLTCYVEYSLGVGRLGVGEAGGQQSFSRSKNHILGTYRHRAGTNSFLSEVGFYVETNDPDAVCGGAGYWGTRIFQGASGE